MKRSTALLPTCLLALLTLTPPLAAQEAGPRGLPKNEDPAASASGGAVLPEVVVSATRTARSAQDVPASVTVLDDNASVFSLATSMRDYQRYEPGVSMPYGVGGLGPGRNSRAGTSGINIRGLDGNRVLMTVDGIRQADQFNFGGSYNVGRDYVDVDSLKRVEILKNAASSLYGSDALGGVVSFTTIDPSDLLALTGRNAVARYITRYDTADSSWGHTLSTAQRAGNVEWLLHYTRRDGNEVDNNGSVPADPLSYNVNNWLAKLVWTPSSRHRLELTGECLERSVDTDVVSSRRVAMGTPVQSLRVNEDMRRLRLSLEHQFDTNGLGLPFDHLTWNVYYQDSFSPEHIEERRAPPGSQRLRVSDYFFRQNHFGLDANFTKELEAGSVHHTLAYGLEAVTSASRRVRDGLEYNLTTGAVLNNFGLAQYPVKDMPDTRTSRIGIYLQDEIAWGENRRFRLIPGVRLEHYDVDARADAAFLRASAGAQPGQYEQFAIAPKLAFLARMDEEHTVYFQYANGFRNPTPEDLNGSITNTINQYQTVANPDLRKETSHSFELGVRRQGSQAAWSLAGFYNYYEDFIQTFAGVAPGPPQIFQSVNLSHAEIYGLEFKGDTQLGFLSESLRDFGVFANAAYIQGYDGQNRQPLGSVDPFKLVAGLRYRRDTWQMELISTYYARQNNTSSTPGSVQQFEPPSAFTLDLVGRWQVTKNVGITAGLYNLTNEQHILYQDVRGTGVGGPAGNDPQSLDRFTQPGINARVAVTVVF